MKLTKYQEVNQVLELLSASLQEILADKLVALYLIGSLSYGDFDYGSSDIDFLAVLTQELNDVEFEAIKKMHRRIAEKVPYWAKRLEGSYIPQQWLRSTKKPQKKRGYVNAGFVTMLPFENEWLIDLYVMYEYGIILFGKSPKQLMQQVDIRDVRKASKKNLLAEWAPKLKEQNPFVHPKYDRSHLQAYAILTMCRILHLASIETVASKKEASSWVKKTYKQWANLIEEAERWKHGIKLNREEETKSFIKFAIDEITNNERKK